MSPSRGLLATTACRAAVLRSAFRSPRQAWAARPQVNAHPTTSYSTVSQFDLNPRPIPQQRQYGHDDARSLQPDVTLFEDEDEQYLKGRTLAPAQQVNHPDLANNDSMQAMLLALLHAQRYADATKALQEMQALATPIEPHSTFAEAALYCAEQGNRADSVAWLQLVPSGVQLEQHGRHAAYTTLRSLTDILAKVLHHFVAALDVERVWNMLLWLARQHYFAVAESESDLPHRMADSLSWLMQYQFSLRTPSHPQPFSTWSVRFWHAFTSLAMRADIEYHMAMERLSYEDAKNVRMTLWMSRVPQTQDPLCKALERMYNTCIRSLCRAQRYDAAIAWLRVSDIFDSRFSSREAMALAYSSSKKPDGQQDWYPANTVNVLFNSTWAFVVHRVLRTPAVDEIQTEMDILTTDLDKQVAALRKQLGAGPTPNVRAANLLRRSRTMLQTVREVLAEPPDEWTSAPTSVKLGHMCDVQTAIVDCMRVGEPMQGLQHYFRHIRDPQLLALTRHVLPLKEYNEAEAAYERAPLEQLHSNTTMSLYGLRCLLHHIHRDPNRVADLYALWLASVAQFQAVLTPDPNVSPCLSEYGQLSADVFEVQGDASQAAIRPSEAHFGAFMRTLPRSLTQVGRKWVIQQAYRTPLNTTEYDVAFADEPDTMQAQPQRTSTSSAFEANAHVDACRWAAQILTDMQRFNMQPDIGMLTWLLDTVARNVDLPPIDRARLLPSDFDADGEVADELAPELDAVWRITKALGMGPSSLEKAEHDYGPAPTSVSSAVQMAAARSGKPRADPMTYAFLMRALVAVPPQRGGPLLHEACMVQRWLDADEYAQHMLDERPDVYGAVAKQTRQIVADTEERARRSRERYLTMQDRDAHAMLNTRDCEAGHFDGAGWARD